MVMKGPTGKTSTSVELRVREIFIVSLVTMQYLKSVDQSVADVLER